MQQEKARAGRSAACAVRLLSPSALVSAFEKHSIFFLLEAIVELFFPLPRHLIETTTKKRVFFPLPA